MDKTRITLQDSTIDVLTKMSDGDPGAFSVCMQLVARGNQIDPDAGMGGLSFLLDMDTLGIYGVKIWVMYKHLCREHLSRMACLLRGWQLGFVSQELITSTLDNLEVPGTLAPNYLNIDDVCAKVCTRLPNFKL